VSFACVRTAVDWIKAGRARALVTAPISKQRWLDSGVPYPGHTTYLAARDQAAQHAMCFWSSDLRVALYTVHVPLAQAAGSLERERVTAFLRFVSAGLRRLFKRPFTLYLCGFNPHAGERGLIGREERDVLEPVVAGLQGEVAIAGIYPADTVFHAARANPDALVIAWYHDQGLIPFKLLHLHDGVNLTLGLSFVRTSPDHGTAEDIAGRGLANPSSMRAAIELAISLL
jgi:4-hydroxythreonine-4-phosphate dehydrogenase